MDDDWRRIYDTYVVANQGAMLNNQVVRRPLLAREEAGRHSTFLGAVFGVVASCEMPAEMARGARTRCTDSSRCRGSSTRASRRRRSASGSRSPRDVIDEAIDLTQAESIESYEYDPESRAIQLRGTRDGS